mmetsp:Transcript_25079/g.67091  ORF Transcript_25079/g.67091 Transcript_25079/m.67091 type:complete len:778 (-) Transcript_25079:146-2479(-)
MGEDEVAADCAITEFDDYKYSCGICEEEDTAANLPFCWRGLWLHGKCQAGRRAHNYYIRDAPQSVHDEIETEFTEDPPAWRKRMLVWVQPDMKSRMKARADASSRQVASVKSSETKSSNKRLDDMMELSLVQFQSWNGFWNRKSDAESQAEFIQKHKEQKGAFDEKDDHGRVIEEKIQVKDISRTRSSKGTVDREAVVEKVVEDDNEGFQSKKRRLMMKQTVQAANSAWKGSSTSSGMLSKGAPSPGQNQAAVHQGSGPPSWTIPPSSAPGSDGTLDAPTLPQRQPSPARSVRSELSQGQSASKRGAKKAKFSMKPNVNIDDQTRERIVPSAPGVEKLEPAEFMQLKQMWVLMAAHVVKGFREPTNGYIKQLKSASHGISASQETDLTMPTAKLIELLEGACNDVTNNSDKIEKECTKADFCKIVLLLHARMNELDGQKKLVQSHITGLSFVSSKTNHQNSVAYMTHYNKRGQVTKRLTKGSYDKILGDGLSRVLYAGRGEAEKEAMQVTTSESGKGKKKKPMILQGVININADYDENKICLWNSEAHEIYTDVQGYLTKLGDLVTAKAGVHETAFKERGEKWLRCLGRISSDIPEYAMKTFADDLVNFNAGAFSPWLCTCRADSLRYGPAAWPLIGHAALAVPTCDDMHFMMVPVEAVLANGIALGDFLKFCETDEGAKVLGDAFYVSAKAKDVIYIPFGMLCVPLFFPPTPATVSGKNVQLLLGNVLVLPLMHKGRVEATDSTTVQAIKTFNMGYLSSQSGGMYKDRKVARTLLG